MSKAEPVGWQYRVKQGGWGGWHEAVPTREEAQACVDMDKELYSIDAYEIRPIFDHSDTSAGLIEAAKWHEAQASAWEKPNPSSSSAWPAIIAREHRKFAAYFRACAGNKGRE